MNKLNKWLGKKLQPNKVETRYSSRGVAFYYEDCRMDDKKVAVCNCTITQPCECISFISIKKLRFLFNNWLASQKNKIFRNGANTVL